MSSSSRVTQYPVIIQLKAKHDECGTQIDQTKADIEPLWVKLKVSAAVITLTI